MSVATLLHTVAAPSCSDFQRGIRRRVLAAKFGAGAVYAYAYRYALLCIAYAILCMPWHNFVNVNDSTAMTLPRSGRIIKRTPKCQPIHQASKCQPMRMQMRTISILAGPPRDQAAALPRATAGRGRATRAKRATNGSVFLEFPTESDFLALTDHCLRFDAPRLPRPMHGVPGAYQWHDYDGMTVGDGQEHPLAALFAVAPVRRQGVRAKAASPLPPQ